MEEGERASRRTVERARLPPKSLAGFAAAVLAIFVILGLTFWSRRAREDATARLVRAQDMELRLEQYVSLLKDAETGQRGYLLTGAERYLEPYHGAVAALASDLTRLHDSLGREPDQLTRLAVLERVTREKMQELAQTVELKRQGKDEEALDRLRTDRGREDMQRIRATVAEMNGAARSLAQARSFEAEQADAISGVVTWGGLALLLVLIGVAAYMSANDFREQRIESWLRAGQGDLGDVMSGEQSVEKLGENIAGFVARYLDAQVGAVYFADGALRCVGGYALPEGAGEREAIGLTKQSVADRQLIRIDDVPDDYFAVHSGLGSSRPRHLVLAPGDVDGAANSVVEMGFLHPIAPMDVEFLRRIGSAVGLALRSARYRRELQELLEETQRQAEELQTQQEELRVQNEELEEQSRVLRESQERLNNQQAELEGINSQLEAQARSLELQRDDLTHAQRDLERASVYKSEFLANMSHELRTPLNSTLILAKLLLDNREGNLTSEQVKFAQTIYAAGNDLLTLINDILDLSKIEAGKLDVRPEVVPIARLLDELTATFQPIAKERHLELTAQIEHGTPASLRIHTDPVRLQQILKNLVSNGLKFTERGGVSLTVSSAPDGRLSFAVKDTGIGIPKEQHALIFEAFCQGDGNTTRRYGGTGLGLSISRDLAQLLGGELHVESAPGRGSTFTLILPPRCPAREVTKRPSPAASLRFTNGADAHAPAVPAVPAAPPSAPNALPAQPVPREVAPGYDDRARIGSGSRVVLVIEDDVHFAKIILGLAHELDFLAVIAETAEDGLALASRYRPSAIVLDVGLPDRSGLSVLDALKHDPALRHIPVHMVSVSDFAQTALEMGAAGYAIKPVKREQLVEAFRKLEAKFTQKLRRLLVVEDDSALRESTCHLLAGDDVEIIAVGTAAEALDQLGRATFDCMVLDLTLPDRNGFELLEEMSLKEGFGFPPVIVYTGLSLNQEEEQGLRRFSSSIIIKGARSPERLLDEVTLFLHQVEADLPPDRQRMLRDARHREAIFEGRRVLVVEDDVRNIFALSSVLEPKGARVEIARNGREALAHLEKNPGVDLVLMDIMMPEMDGLQATREIRKRPENAKLPIIALTAKAMADDREHCLAVGANDYIAKPLDVDKLLSLARVWMPK